MKKDKHKVAFMLTENTHAAGVLDFKSRTPPN
jgi:hypothetical protein